jgi:hypothetical protein
MASKDIAIQQATALLGPGAAELLADPQFPWDTLLAQSVIPDDDGRMPDDPNWVPAYDPTWLAATAASLLATWASGSGSTKRLSVDGDSIEVIPANWQLVADRLFKQSPLAKLLPDEGMIYVAGHPTHYVPPSRGVFC